MIRRASRGFSAIVVLEHPVVSVAENLNLCFLSWPVTPYTTVFSPTTSNAIFYCSLCVLGFPSSGRHRGKSVYSVYFEFKL